MGKKRNCIEISESESETESSQPESDDESVVEITSSTSCDDDGDDDDFDDSDDDSDDFDDSDDDDFDDSDDDSDDFDDSDDDDCDIDNDDDDCDDNDDERRKRKGFRNEEEYDGHVDMKDEESVCNKVIQFIQGKGHIKELKLVECKVFLRKHGLRLSGTKEECFERIKEFWRLRNGNGETFYPRSSFIIDCTGDVCRGDVVLFTQKVYESFDKVKRHGNVLGRRTVAGRIVTESYGAARQQHTFTVEVLWSKGTNKLAPLCPLLVKGRNLYRMKTFRQRWKNERERLKVLDEKHERGAAARAVRAVRKTKMAMKANKSSTSKGVKVCKHSHALDPSGTKLTSHAKKNTVNKHAKKNSVNKHANAFQGNKKPSFRQNSTYFQEPLLRQTRDSRAPVSNPRHQRLNQENLVRETFHLFHSVFSPGRQNHFDSYRGSAPTSTSRQFHPHPNSVLNPALGLQEFSNGSFIGPNYSYFGDANDSRMLNRIPGSRDFPPFNSSSADSSTWR